MTTPGGAPLRRSDLDPDPLVQLRAWLREAADAGVVRPSSAVLCTVDVDGRPTARSIPVRKIEPDGLLVFTNTTSGKATDLLRRPDATTLLFVWQEVGRQVRVDAVAHLLDRAAADRWFAAQPRDAQMNAWSSRQSVPLRSRDELEALTRATEERFGDAGTVPRPDNWGVFRLEPRVVEFWQVGAGRQHDRLRYARGADPTGWVVERIAP